MSSAERFPTSGCTIAFRSFRAASSAKTIAEAGHDGVVPLGTGLDDLASDRVRVDHNRAVLGEQRRHGALTRPHTAR